MAWIPSYQELRDHPKVYALADESGIPVAQAIGHLHLLWWWAIDHAPNGDLAGFSEAAISRAGLWDRDDDFVALLVAAGFLDEDRKLHKWGLYAGRFALINEARREAGRLGAAARWDAERERKRAGQMASPSQSHSNGMATPMQEVEVEVEVEREEEKEPKSARRKKPLINLPRDWKPSPADIEAVKKRHPHLTDNDLEVETQNFTDWAEANGRKYAQWGAAWRKWIGKGVRDFGLGSNGNGHAPGVYSNPADADYAGPIR